MRTCILLVAITSWAIAETLPKDTELAQQMLGTWRSDRHDYKYSADGTWMMDPQDFDLLQGHNTHGKWQIKKGRIIWTTEADKGRITEIQEIVEITPKILKFRVLSEQGAKQHSGQLPCLPYTLHRVTPP